VSQISVGTFMCLNTMSAINNKETINERFYIT
jgi:hypothetical protein